MPALYSQIPRPFWRALAGFPAIGCAAPLPSHWFIFIHCTNQKEFPLHRKTQYSFRISGDRGYVSNGVRFLPSEMETFESAVDPVLV